MISQNEYAPYYETYIKLFKDVSVLDSLQKSQTFFDEISLTIPTSKENFAYASNKWTIKQVIQHIIDTERIFTYRALCFARGDNTSLPGFDQDLYVENCDVSSKSLSNLIEEMKVLRLSTTILFQHFSNEEMLSIGVANGNQMSVRAVGYVLSGHQMHHTNIIKERYL